MRRTFVSFQSSVESRFSPRWQDCNGLRTRDSAATLKNGQGVSGERPIRELLFAKLEKELPTKYGIMGVFPDARSKALQSASSRLVEAPCARAASSTFVFVSACTFAAGQAVTIPNSEAKETRSSSSVAPSNKQFLVADPVTLNAFVRSCS